MSALPKHVKELLDAVYGPRWGEAYLEWGTFPAAQQFRREGFGRAANAAPPDDQAVFWSAGLFKPGSGRGNINVEKVMVFVLDDVGFAPKSKISPLDLLALPEPTIMIESSPGNWQWQWGISGGMDVDVYEALRASILFVSDATAPSNLIRLPMGVNGKPGVDHRVTGSPLGPVCTAEELIAGFGGLKVTVKAVRKSRAGLLAPSVEHVRAALAALPNDGKAAYCADYKAWITFGMALYGATGGEGVGEWIDWNSSQDQDYDLQYVWDSFHSTGIGWVKLAWMAREYGLKAFEAAIAASGPERFNDNAPPPSAEDTEVTMFTVDDFRAVSGEVDFIHVGSGNFWKAVNVDAKVAPMAVGDKTIKATAWMRSHRYVTELSWLPGRERIIEDAALGVTGLERRLMHHVFNLYTAPPVVPVEEIDARVWCDLVRKLWPYEYDEIMNWFAHRVQHPGEKCNHALVLGGAPGIGKDTVLEAVRRAVGEGNCAEITPSHLRGSFNDHIKSVLLTINELRDDGSVSQFAFYELTKTLIAAPPYTLSVNTKYVKPYVVPNVCGVVMTTNHKQTGLFLPADDRRHLVAWSEEPAIKEDDTEFRAIWAWLNGGGFAHVAAWLRARDISKFDAKAPPRKTQAFYDIVEAAGSGQEKALQDKMERMGTPHVLRVKDLKADINEAMDDDSDASMLDVFLTDPKYRRVLAEALDRAGYRQVRNPWRKDGRWRINGGNPEIIYGRKDIDKQELVELARKLAENDGNIGGNA